MRHPRSVHLKRDFVSKAKANHSRLILFFGQLYDTRTELPYAIYGRTDDLPPYAGEGRADAGFLRVPFRRIPKLLIRNRKQFDFFVKHIVSADPNLITLFRGQTREYLLNRGK